MLGRCARSGLRGTALGAVLTVVSTLAVACSSDPPPPPPPPPPVDVAVVHDGTTTDVRVRTGRTVGDAIEKSGVEGREGQELAAESKEPIGPNGNEVAYLVDGLEVSLAEVIDADTTIEVVDGEDSVEPTEVIRREQAVPGLPDALQYVQRAGKTGVEDATVGTKSGETVSAVTITPAVPAHRATGKVVALTFDDGPSPTYTPDVLKILKDKGVPATFCTIGSEVDEHPDLVQQIVDEGHQLCNHTQSHAEGLEDEPRETVEAEMGGGREAIVDAVGEPAPFYRPPGGSLGPVIYEVAAEAEEVVLYWSIDPRDWQKPSTEELLAGVVNQLEPGGIILLHDGGGNRDATVAALPAIIDFAEALGYTFVAPISGRPQVG
ncbi:polysaccharide deacetylase family protein [Aquihabitans daechungensis]|uniref:polysaccharide deacetylase family protein n=1 Tax=Aquihabitans daechungensis TaxID=1052257 RepID=UPI003BA2F10C